MATKKKKTIPKRRKSVLDEPTPKKRKVNPYMEAAKEVGRTKTALEELRARKKRLLASIKATDEAIEERMVLHEKAVAMLTQHTEKLRQETKPKKILLKSQRPPEETAEDLEEEGDEEEEEEDLEEEGDDEEEEEEEDADEDEEDEDEEEEEEEDDDEDEKA